MTDKERCQAAQAVRAAIACVIALDARAAQADATLTRPDLLMSLEPVGRHLVKALGLLEGRAHES